MSDRDDLALVISNAYRARHGQDPLTQHAHVDEDIADAILAAGWTPTSSTPEWEYGWSGRGSEPGIALTRENAQWYADNLEPEGFYIVQRRVKAGPWMPLNTEPQADEPRDGGPSIPKTPEAP